MAQLEQAREQAHRTQQALAEVSATATSRDRMVSATVDAQGAVTGLKFHSTRYRSMAAAELSAALLDTIRQAQDEATAQVSQLLQPVMPGGLDLGDALGGHGNLSEMLDAFTHGSLPGQRG
ncbi:YbaB/EbfC family nucleoid-associated protein [Streptomyces celluloflavus]|uniref:YbaB/EbfC family nucleoid-associated protein n=1 Tax=Streptomyces celluloflavus TaxID=58344 RepID=UPI0036CEE1E1